MKYTEILTQVASAEPSDGGIFGALGIDWQALILQIIAFLILVFLLGKFVYPWLMKQVDERQEKIEESIKAADEAKAKADDAEAEIAKVLKQARAEAGEIITVAKEEATAAIEAAEEKAKKRADTIIATAQEQLEKDVLAAKKALRNETLDLVAMATEKVVGAAVSKDIDQSIISASLKGSK